MWIWLAIFLIFYLLAKIEWNRQRITRQFKHIPGPKDYPIIGNIFAIKITDGSNFESLCNQVCIAPVCKLTFGGKLVFLITDPEISKRILMNKEFSERPYHFEFLRLKYALFSAKHPIWKPIRKATNISLNQTSVLDMVPIFNKHLDKLCNTLGGFIDKGTFNVEDSIVKFGIEQVFETMVDYEYKCSDEVKEAFQTSAFVVIKRALNIFLYPDFIYDLTPSSKKVTRAYGILAELYKPVIEKRRKMLELGGERRNFIDDLIKMEKDGKKFSDELIQENFTAIILAGYETTSLTIAYAILMLAMHPEIDEKLFNEINEFYKDGDELTYDTVKQMKYLDMVVKETLRLLPVVPGSLRENLSDVFIEGIGMIPKGTIIGLPFFKMHRETEIWGNDAKKFNPDHFLPEKVAKRHPYAYLPFSAGPRNCIGLHYANVNIRMGLAKIFSKYRFTTKMKLEDLQFRLAFTLRLSSEHAVEVFHR